MITAYEAKRIADGVGSELREIRETIKHTSLKGEYVVCVATRKEFIEEISKQLTRDGFTLSHVDNGVFDPHTGNIVDLTVQWGN